ncbi:MAG: hypothetical protein DYH20_04840 [Gammaproteobacteria bacterium PRO9]|nr:hypothetical protein [Gammaproteobacteria bacterium PRO9]
MQPLTVIIGIVLGSVFSIAFSLGIVLLVFGLRHDQSVRYALEIPELIRATVLFSLLTAISVPAFIGSVRAARWRHWPMLALVVGLVAVGFYYWPA